MKWVSNYNGENIVNYKEWKCVIQNYISAILLPFKSGV